MPTPQSPRISPTVLHCGYGELVPGRIPPVSLLITRLSRMTTSLIDPPLSDPVAGPLADGALDGEAADLH
jgi:hypothetical protein